MATDKQKTYYGTGRRKEATAAVWISQADEKSFTVNETPFDTYFTRETSKMIVNQPLEITNLVGQFAVKATVKGGGPNGQAGALRLGIARALVEFNEELKTVLRRGGLLTRDPRKKERKKFGRKGARRSFQFSKR